MSTATPITIAYGDGIGPEIMDATLRILTAASARIAPEAIDIGERVYLRGIAEGIEPSAWESLRRTRVFLKAPVTTPQGGGFKSLNVTTRKTMGLYANVRPCVSYHPYVATKHPTMDVVIVRENEEDLYAGIEYRQTDDMMQSLKLISRPGCEKIVRYAFDYARRTHRHKVTCFTKDNIMKMSDGLFHRVFDEIAAEYPDIENEHWIVDIGAAKLADTPEAFDVLVMPNLYGDILSDVAAQIAGSVGLAGSANVGDHGAMFEAIHGSAPRRAGQNLANPSGLLLGAIMMLVHINQPDVATTIHNAWLRTLEDGVHTYDVFAEGTSTRKVGTREFADAVIERLGERPASLKAVEYAAAEPRASAEESSPATVGDRSDKRLAGVDVFIDWRSGDPNRLGAQVTALGTPSLPLASISNRGVKVWPDGLPETFCTHHWRCRFLSERPDMRHADIAELLHRFDAAGFDFIKTENLYTFNGQPGYSTGQG